MAAARGAQPGRAAKAKAKATGKALPKLKVKAKAKAKAKAKVKAKAPASAPKAKTARQAGSRSVESTWRELKVSLKKGWEEVICREEPPPIRIRDVGFLCDRGEPEGELVCSARMRVRPQKELASGPDPEQAAAKLAAQLVTTCRYPPSAVRAEVRRMPPGAPTDLVGTPAVQPPFRPLGNASDQPAAQPPHFARYPLRPEQLRSLGWMLKQERGEGAHFEAEWRLSWVDPHTCGASERRRMGVRPFEFSGFGFDSSSESDSESSSRGAAAYAREMLDCQRRGTLPYTLDLRVRPQYAVRGGILADKIGYGKTAATIGLIDTQLNEPVPPVPSYDRGAFLPTQATLILVPSNLLEQWLGEISKFTGDGSCLKTKMARGWVARKKYGGPFNIFACTSVAPLKGVSAAELADADIVLCTYRLLFSPVYKERLTSLSCGRGRMVWNIGPSGRLEPQLAAGGSGEVTFDGPMPPCRGGSLGMLREVTRRLNAGTVQVPKAGAGRTRKASELTFPVLEMFFWRRVVFDEFHELEGFPVEQQSSLQHLRSHYRWGLTGTPPLDSVRGAIFMSSLFRIDLTGFDPMSNGWRTDKLLLEGAGRFVSEFLRQNTAELQGIALQEHLVPIRQTPRERVLYLGQARDIGAGGPWEDGAQADAEEEEEEERGGGGQRHPQRPGPAAQTEAVDARAQLLKLCSHFQVGRGPKGGAKNAEEECKRIHDLKERRVIEARNRVSRGLRAIRLLEGLLTSAPCGPRAPWLQVVAAAAEELAKGGKRGQEASQLLAAEEACSKDVPAEDLPAELDGFRPQDAELKRALGSAPAKTGAKKAWAALQARTMDKRAVEKLLMGAARDVVGSLRDSVAAGTSLDFFQQTLRVFQDGATSSARACTVCLADDLPLSKLAITPCSHVFCVQCLQQCVKKFHRCSLCNAQLADRDVAPLGPELAAAAAGRPSGAGSAPPAAKRAKVAEEKKRAIESEGDSAKQYSKYGTKLAAIVEKLHEIRREDPTAKVILFAQFDDLRLKIASAFREFGVPLAQLQGNPAQRDRVIREWQGDETAEQFVLLLSLEQSASGTNLTAANHVVFVHPMLAATQEKAVSFELQAIGRARRHGQKKDTVHVWRFVTLDTIEEDMTRRHQAELFERERGRASAAPTSSGASSSSSSSSPSSASGCASPASSAASC